MSAGPRLHSELLDQGVAGGAVSPERVRLPARAVEREHELRARPLAQRLRVDDGLQLGHELDVAAEREIGVDSFLQRHEPKLLEPRDLRLREGLVREVGERRPAPERKRLAQSRRRTRCIPGGQALPAFVCEPREAVHVHSQRIELEHVAGRAPGDRLRPEHLPELRDVHLYRMRGRVWRLARPEDLDQLIDGDDAARVERQCCQERPRLGAAECDSLSLPRHLTGTKKPDVELRGALPAHFSHLNTSCREAQALARRVGAH